MIQPLSDTAKKILNCCRQGQLDQLLHWLDSGIDLAAVNHPDFAPLNVSLRHGRWKIAKHLLTSQCMPQDSPSPPLVAAAQFKKDMTQGIEMVYAHCADRSVADKNGRTALMTACLLGHEKKVKFLLQHTENINAVDNHGISAILDAVISQSQPILELLIAQQADVNQQNKQGDNALLIALEQPNPAAKVIKSLLDNGVDCTQKNLAGKSAYSVAEKKHPQILKLFVTKIESDKQMELPLFVASTNEQPDRTPPKSDRIQTIDNTPDTKAQLSTNEPNSQAWFDAIAAGNLGQINQLKVKGVPIDLVDSKGCTGLIHAAGKGLRAVASYFIQNHANVEHRSNNGSTPLSSAIISNSHTLVGLLLSNGANPNLTGPGNYPYISLAATQWSEACVSMLLDAGGDINTRDEAGMSLYHHVAIAAKYYTNTAKAKGTIRLLKQYGLEINSQNSQGNSALHVLCGAMEKNSYQADDSHLANIAHEMLKSDINPKLVNNQGFTAIQYTKQHGLLNTKGVILSYVDAW